MCLQNRGIARHSLGNNVEAIEDFTSCLSEPLKNALAAPAKVHWLRSGCYLDMARYRDAVDDLTQLAESASCIAPVTREQLVERARDIRDILPKGHKSQAAAKQQLARLEALLAGPLPSEAGKPAAASASSTASSSGRAAAGAGASAHPAPAPAAAAPSAVGSSPPQSFAMQFNNDSQLTAAIATTGPPSSASAAAAASSTLAAPSSASSGGGPSTIIGRVPSLRNHSVSTMRCALLDAFTRLYIVEIEHQCKPLFT